MSEEVKIVLGIAALFALAAVVTLVMSASSIAFGQSLGQMLIKKEIPIIMACGPADQMFKELKARYREEARWTGTLEGGQYILFSADDTWTLVAATGNGACIMGAGKASTFRLGDPV